jgi:EmrB/QacA subfamily drug resistance transporter
MVTERQRNPWLILLVLCFGFFMILLDTTIVNIAIPSIIDGLKASLDQILWVVNAYILVYAILLITAGRLGDFFGQRNLFAAGLVIFTAASAACGLAQDPNQLIAFRVVQGVGGALIWPQTLAIITTIFPREQRGAAFGVWGAVAGLAATAGPTVGGWLTTDFTWRAIFYLNVPIGIAVLIATFLIVPDLRQGHRHRLDLVGVLLSSVGLFGIVYGLIEGQPKNWGALLGPITIWETIAAGVVVLGAFLFWESRQKEPLLPLSLFTENRNFSLMNIVAAAMSFGLLGLLLPFIIYLQSVLGMTALQAGLTIAPWSLVSMIVAPNAGRLADRIGGKFILMGGLAFFALGLGLIIWTAGIGSRWYNFLPAVITAGFGMGMVFVAMTQVAMREIRPQLAGAASGVLNTNQQMGAVIGSAGRGRPAAVEPRERPQDGGRESLGYTASTVPPAVHRRLFARGVNRPSGRPGPDRSRDAPVTGRADAGGAAALTDFTRRVRQRLPGGDEVDALPARGGGAAGCRRDSARAAASRHAYGSAGRGRLNSGQSGRLNVNQLAI